MYGDKTSNRAPAWFWVVAGLALLWNLMGVAAYLMQVTMSPEALAALPESEQALHRALPKWVTGAFAVAVFSGTAGLLALLLRRAWAVPLLVLSLLGVLIQNVYNFFLSNTFEVLGSGAMVMPLMVITISLLLVLFAMTAKSKTWIY